MCTYAWRQDTNRSSVSGSYCLLRQSKYQNKFGILFLIFLYFFCISTRFLRIQRLSSLLLLIYYSCLVAYQKRKNQQKKSSQQLQGLGQVPGTVLNFINNTPDRGKKNQTKTKNQTKQQAVKGCRKAKKTVRMLHTIIQVCYPIQVFSTTSKKVLKQWKRQSYERITSEFGPNVANISLIFTLRMITPARLRFRRAIRNQDLYFISLSIHYSELTFRD